jgi:hypothetical protein
MKPASPSISLWAEMNNIHFGGKTMVCDKKCENIAKIPSLLILFYRKYLYL